MRYWLCLVVLMGLAACESRPVAMPPIVPGSRVPKPAVAVALAGADSLGPLPPVALAPTDTAANRLPLLLGQVGYHRYRGRIGGRAVVLELTVSAANSDRYSTTQCVGRYYFEQGGQGGQLEALTFRPAAPLVLHEQTGDGSGGDSLGCWQARQPVGPVLAGTWASVKTHQQQPFDLREDYTEAVRYEILTEAYRQPCADTYRPREAVYSYLHLLGPGVAPAVQRALRCPSAAERRRRVRQAWQGTSCEGELGQVYYGDYSGVSVEFNEGNLLSLLSYTYQEMGAAYPTPEQEINVYDLTTGRAHRVANWFQPTKTAQLKKLLARYLAQDRDYRSYSRLTPNGRIILTQTKLPEFGLDADGIYCQLDAVADVPHAIAGRHMVLPYAALAPYVRPGTPLARLVATRSRPRR